MRLTKYTHACVRLEDGDRVLVIDPGSWSEAHALDGVDDILVTHEHFDHIDVDRLVAAAQGNPRLTVHTHAALAAQLPLNVNVVAVGQTFTAGGFSVQVVGGEHAEIYDGLPGCANVGFLVEGVYHPGDAFFVPQEQVETLLVPASAPWLKLAEALDFVRAVKPGLTVPIHDAMLSTIGLESFDRWMGMKGETEYTRLAAGDSITV